MRVEILSEKTLPTCPCGSWLKHWLKYNPGGPNLPEYCAEISCFKSPSRGALVIPENDTERRMHVVPLCRKHSRRSGALELAAAVPLVPYYLSRMLVKVPGSEDHR